MPVRQIVTTFVTLVTLAVGPALADRGAAADAVNRAPEGAAAARRLLSPEEIVARIRQLDPSFPERAAPGAIGCRIEDAFGNSVTTVSVLEQSGDPAYWLQYLNDGQVDRVVRFVVTPAFEGSPLAGQIQIFRTGDACSVVTPFGIPFWGLDLTSGPWVLVVTNDRGLVATCPFEVVP